MASLPLIFCWRKHIFVIIPQLSTKQHLSSYFWNADPLNIIDLSLLIFLRKTVYWYMLYSTYWEHTGGQQVFQKHQIELNGVEWYHMTYFFWNQWKTADITKNNTWKVLKRRIVANNNIIAFEGRVIHPSRENC